MSALDSRALTYLDCYGQRFSTPGQVRYAITGPLAARLRVDDQPYLLQVADQQAAEPQQHDIEVRYENGAFTAVPPELAISAGDVVLWHAAQAATPPYAVWGEGEDGSFSSTSLQAEAVYSHAFGSAGDVEWTDMNQSGVGGLIRVHDLDATDRDACERWGRVLCEGAVVVVERDRVDLPELEIVTGQTVFFAVTQSSGMTVTDATLAIPVR
jgi:plastocyanin